MNQSQIVLWFKWISLPPASVVKVIELVPSVCVHLYCQLFDIWTQNLVSRSNGPRSVVWGLTSVGQNDYEIHGVGGASTMGGFHWKLSYLRCGKTKYAQLLGFTLNQKQNLNANTFYETVFCDFIWAIVALIRKNNVEMYQRYVIFGHFVTHLPHYLWNDP